MIRSVDPTTLADYVAHYALTHPLERESIRQYEIAVRLIDRWAGHPVRIDELDSQLVSAWLADYGKTVRPNTARSKRQMILALWRSAVDDGFHDPVSLMRRVRRVRVPIEAPVAWTRQEIERLIAACATMPRWHRCGLRRSEWWALAIRVAYDTGLRWEDQVRRLRVDQVTGLTGWTAVPTSVKQATVITAARIFKRLDSPLGVAGFGDMGVMRVGRGLDPDVQQLVQDFRRMENIA